MTPDQATDILRTSLIMVLLVAGPVMLVGLLVGLLISVIQAVTQIQEQTLTFIPKIAAMLITTIILLPWISLRLIEFTQQLFRNIALP